MRRLFVAALLSLFALSSCRTLPTIDRGVCGNGVVEPGEDCDLFAPAGSLCRPPGQVDACRYDCSVQPDNTKPNCPDGFGCGADGVCRRASGAFDSNAVIMAGAPQQLNAADLDDDRRQDLIVTEQTRVAVRYFGDQAAPDAELDIPSSPGPSPAIAKLSGDPGDPDVKFRDVVVDYGGGITVALGNAGRSLISTTYPSLEAPPNIDKAMEIPGTAIPDKPVGGLALGGLKGFTGSALVYVTPTSMDVLGGAPYSVDDISGEIAVGTLDEALARSPCNGLLMPFKGADRIYEFSPCVKDSGGHIVVNKKAATPPVMLAAGETVIGPLALLDLDGDGHLDLAVGTAHGSDHGIDVAYGVGDGTFNSTTPVPASQGDDVTSRVAGIKQATPLAIGDLDGDGSPDYVDAQGVYVARPGGFKLVGEADSEGFSEALIADLNANGKPDVLAANANESGAIYFSGAGGGLMSRFDVPTEGPLSHLSTGDFDGDQLGDVAAIQHTSDGDLLSVIFGNAYGAPDPPMREGLLDKVQQVVSFRSASIYAIDSINTVSLANDGGLAFATFGGRGDRVLRATFGMFQGTPTGLVVYVPARLVAGSFDGDKHKDVAELALRYDHQPQEFRLWLTPMIKRAEIQLSDPQSTDPLPTDVDWAASEMAAGNLDKKGPDELVLLAPLKDGSGSRGYVVKAADTGSGHYAFKLGKPVTLAWRFEHTEGQGVAPGDPGGGRIVVADVDADRNHYVDVLALAPTEGKKKGALIWFRGDGTAALGKAEKVPDTPDGPATAFTTIQADRDPALELALLAGSNVYIADIGSDGSYHVAGTPVIDLGAAGIANAGLIAAGDFDGDGVQDIAVGNATSVAVFRGVPGTH